MSGGFDFRASASKCGACWQSLQESWCNRAWAAHLPWNRNNRQGGAAPNGEGESDHLSDRRIEDAITSKLSMQVLHEVLTREAFTSFEYVCIGFLKDGARIRLKTLLLHMPTCQMCAHCNALDPCCSYPDFKLTGSLSLSLSLSLYPSLTLSSPLTLSISLLLWASGAMLREGPSLVTPAVFGDSCCLWCGRHCRNDRSSSLFVCLEGRAVGPTSCNCNPSKATTSH